MVFCDVFQESRPRHTDTDPAVGVAVRLVSPSSGEGFRSAARLSVHIGLRNIIPGQVFSQCTFQFSWITNILKGKKTLNFVYPTEVNSKTHHQIATGNNFKLKHLLVQAYWQKV